MLLAQMPPLGFGTTMLEDGSNLSCLTEAEDVRDARDIGALGAWQAFL